MAIERRALREQVREELLARMRAGAVHPGEGINEVSLAADLGVSRTPLREALIALESEGQIESQNGRGFRFVPLSKREFEDLAPIMAALEGLALELSREEELRHIGARLGKLAADFDTDVAQHSTIMERDDEWHLEMLSACPNERLLAHIAGVRQAFHRYESLLVPDEAMVARASEEHRRIAERLADGDVKGAREALKVNWVNGARRIVERGSGPYVTD